MQTFLANGFIAVGSRFIDVVEDNKYVKITGFNGYVFTNDLYKHYGTSRINKHMFVNFTRNYIVMHKFYALEFRYIVNDLIENGKRINTSQRSLTIIRNKLDSNTWIGRYREEPIQDIPGLEKVIGNFKKTPKDFQMGFLKAFNDSVYRLGLKGQLLDATPGAGKTYTAMLLFMALGADHVIVLAPKNVIDDAWSNSINYEHRDCELTVKKTYWSSTQDSFDTLDFSKDYTLVNYEAIGKLIEALKKVRHLKKIAIVVDESHNFNSKTSARFLALRDLINNTKSIQWVLPMTGTSIKAYPSEAAVVISMLDPMFNDKVMESYTKIYGSDVNAATAILTHRLNNIKFVVTREQIGIEKPIITNIPIKVKDGDKYTLDYIGAEMRKFMEERLQYYKYRYDEDYAVYDNYLVRYRNHHGMDKDYNDYMRRVKALQRAGAAAWTMSDTITACKDFERKYIHPLLSPAERKEFDSLAALIKYPVLKVRGECLGRIVLGARIKAEIAIAEALNLEEILEKTPKKTVIFTNFVDVLKGLINRFHNEGINGCFAYAETSKHLPEILDKFTTDEDLNPLVTTFKSLSTGVRLTMADHEVLVAAPFRDYTLTQTIARINRNGMTTPSIIDIYLLDTGEAPNITTRNLDILMWSRSQVKIITGYDAPFDLDDAPDASLVTEFFGEPNHLNIKLCPIWE